MKVFIDYRLNDTGKGKFLARLLPPLEDLGVKCTFRSDKINKCDVALGVNRWRNKIKIPKLLRIDGVHFWKNDKSNWRNDRVRKSMKKATGIIWQSEFSKYMVSGLFRFKAKKEYVIMNGANPADYDVEPLSLSHPYNILMSARWKERKHKRFKEMSRIAMEYVEMNPSACFWIAGKYDKKYADHDRIKHLWHVPEQKLRRLIKACDVMLNIAWFDWMPNAVVEALVAGLPVICSNGCGVEEAVQDAGTVLKLDKPLKPKMIPSNKPPAIDHMPVLGALNHYFLNRTEVHVPRLFIENIAKQYKKAFEDVA